MSPGCGSSRCPAFSTREALNYLSGRLTTDPDQRSGAIDLAGELGGEPAALAQAAAVILSSGIRCREYRDYFARRRAQRAAAAADPPAAAGSPGRCPPATPGGWHRAAGTWPLLALAALLDGQAIPGTVFTASATCQYLSGRGRCTASRIRSGPGPRCRPCSGPGCCPSTRRHPASGVGEPGAAGGGPRGSAAGSAGPGGPGRGRCAGGGVAGRSAAVVAGRGPAVVRRQPAAGRR